MLYYATKIKMNYGYRDSQYPQDSAQIYIHGEGWIKKGDLHDYLKSYPNTVVVNISPYPYLIPAVSSRGEKYVKSTPDSWKHDDRHFFDHMNLYRDLSFGTGEDNIDWDDPDLPF